MEHYCHLNQTKYDCSGVSQRKLSLRDSRTIVFGLVQMAIVFHVLNDFYLN